jgi:hypothetical protein
MNIAILIPLMMGMGFCAAYFLRYFFPTWPLFLTFIVAISLSSLPVIIGQIIRGM